MAINSSGSHRFANKHQAAMSDIASASKLGYAPDSTVIVPRGATDIASAVNLRAAGIIAAALRPGGNAPAADNRVAVIMPSGRYDFVLGDGSNHGLIVDTQFVDWIGETGIKEDVVLTSQIVTESRGTVEQTVDDVKMRGFTMDINSASAVGANETKPAAYFPDDGLSIISEQTDMEYTTQNSNSRVMRGAIDTGGAFTDCVSADFSFGSDGGIASGTFTNCVGGIDSFGGDGTASGVFNNCVGGYASFGGGGGIASGTFTDCAGEDYSFGSMGTAPGEFNNCTGGEASFGGSGTASGTFIDCVGLDYSFGGNSTATVMRRCRSVERSDAIKNWQGLMIDCEIEVIGANKNAVEITAATARIYGCILIANGSGKSVYAASNLDCRIANLLANKAINLNGGTNLIGTPNVIDDSEVSL